MFWMMQNLSYCSKLLAAVHDANGMAKREKNRAASSPARLEGYDNLYMDIEIVFVAGGYGWFAFVETGIDAFTLVVEGVPLAGESKADMLIENIESAQGYVGVDMVKACGQRAVDESGSGCGAYAAGGKNVATITQHGEEGSLELGIEIDILHVKKEYIGSSG